MTQALKDLWKKNFPAWPDALIEKFENEIILELNLYGSNTGDNEKKFYYESLKDITKTFVFKIESQKLNPLIMLANPSNPTYTIKEPFNFTLSNIYFNIKPTIETFETSQFHSQISVMLNVIFDYRIFGKQIDFEKKIYYEKIQNSFFHSYYNQDLQPVVPVLEITISSQQRSYDGAKSLIALYENGYIFQNLKYPQLYEFLIYLEAYRNYEQEIYGQKDIAKKNALSELQNYKADLDSKLLAQKNVLQNLTLQLMTQTQGQADSARRDMQQLNLQAVSLKLQILGLMKK